MILSDPEHWYWVLDKLGDDVISEIRGYNEILNVYIDDELLFKYQDKEYPLLSGGVAIFLEGKSEFVMDDVEIIIVSEEDIVYP